MRDSRESVIIRTSIIGILANILLAGFKAALGLAVNSIAVTLDAVNNLSDALSSVITIVGTKLSAKLPDKKHPLGYGRIEYLSAMIVAGIVLYAGITSAVESIKSIIYPETASYTTVSLAILNTAIIVKLLLGMYVKKKGREVNSGALVASGSDSVFDAVLSLSVLISALIFMFTGVSLEAYVGLVISIVIIKSGIEMMRETVAQILGERGAVELTGRIMKLVSEEPDVRGAYDLVLYNYGPDRNLASVHVELPDDMTVARVDEITRHIEQRVLKETGVIITGVGVYSYNTLDGEAAKIRDDISRMVISHEWALQMHGFYMDREKMTIRFDVVISFGIDPMEKIEQLYVEMGKAYPEYTFTIAPDFDVSLTD